MRFSRHKKRLWETIWNVSDVSSNERLLPHDSSKDFRTVFVSNLSFEVDEEELKTFFSKVRNAHEILVLCLV